MAEENQLHLDDIVYWLNQARENPQSFIPFIQKHLENFRNQYQLEYAPNCFIKTQEGKKAWIEAIEFLKQQKSQKGLKRNSGLNKASQDHAKDLVKNDAFGNVGSDGSTVNSRIKRYCKFEEGIIGETVSQQFKKKVRNHARQTVLSLIVSDGLLDRSDRKSIFNPQFKYFGASIQSNSYRYVTVINYSSLNLSQLTNTTILSEKSNTLQNSHFKKLPSPTATTNSQNNSNSLNSWKQNIPQKPSTNTQRVTLH